MELLTKDVTLGFYNETGILSIPISQYDTARIISIALTNDGEEYVIPDDITIIFKAQKPDGTQINESGHCTVSNNRILLQVFEQLSIVAGVVRCELILTDGDVKITVNHFNIVVDKTVHEDENLKSTDAYSDFVEVSLRVTETMNRLDELMPQILYKKDKDVAGGVAGLDDNVKIAIDELYEATTSSKGITQLTDSVESDSITTAATPNSVKIVNDSLNDLSAEYHRHVIVSDTEPAQNVQEIGDYWIQEENI